MNLVLLALAASLYPWTANAVTVADVAGIASIAASSGTIIREGRDLFANPWKTLKRHGSQLKAAVKGTPKPVEPVPVPFPVHNTSKVTQ